jgi:hypothetical protein
MLTVANPTTIMFLLSCSFFSCHAKCPLEEEEEEEESESYSYLFPNPYP